MERNIQLDWPRFVEEAVRRRKEQGLTQKQLAVLAGISGPTVNRFEQGKGNITVKSAFAILELLGLMRRHGGIGAKEVMARTGRRGGGS